MRGHHHHGQGHDCDDGCYPCGGPVIRFPYCHDHREPDIIVAPEPCGYYPDPLPPAGGSPFPPATSADPLRPREQFCVTTHKTPPGRNPVTGTVYPGTSKGFCTGPGGMFTWKHVDAAGL